MISSLFHFPDFLFGTILLINCLNFLIANFSYSPSGKPFQFLQLQANLIFENDQFTRFTTPLPKTLVLRYHAYDITLHLQRSFVMCVKDQ